MIGKTWLLWFAAVITASCAPISSEIRKQADETLTYQIVQRNPDEFVGKTVIWGGVVVQANNRENGSDLIVRQTELDYEERPKNLDRSAGRFIARYPGFLDPAIYQSGREVTVAGEIAGKELQNISGVQYSYPVIKAKQVHLWERPAVVSPYYYYPYPYYWDPFWGPYWYPYPYWWYYPHRRW